MQPLFIACLFACFFFKTVSYLDFHFSDKAPCPEAAWGAYGLALSSNSITDVSQSRNSGRKWKEELKQRHGGVMLMGLLSLLPPQDNNPGSGTTHMIWVPSGHQALPPSCLSIWSLPHLPVGVYPCQVIARLDSDGQPCWKPVAMATTWSLLIASPPAAAWLSPSLAWGSCSLGFLGGDSFLHLQTFSLLLYTPLQSTRGAPPEGPWSSFPPLSLMATPLTNSSPALPDHATIP